jgi:TPR repeat protein
VAPIQAIAFQMGVAIVPFVGGWLAARVLRLVLKQVANNTLWIIGAVVLILIGMFGKQQTATRNVTTDHSTIPPSAQRVEQVSTEIEAKCVDAYEKMQWETARQACTTAAQGGNATAQATLGDMYTHGYGVVQDHIAAVRWHSLAAQQGVARAQWILGRKYQEGKGVAQDYTQALYWHRLASSQRNDPVQALAQFDIGIIYQNGLGVPQDFVRAHMWLNISAATGSGFSAHARDILAARMTQVQIAQAQKMANECIASNYRKC